MHQVRFNNVCSYRQWLYPPAGFTQQPSSEWPCIVGRSRISSAFIFVSVQCMPIWADPSSAWLVHACRQAQQPSSAVTVEHRTPISSTSYIRDRAFMRINPQQPWCQVTRACSADLAQQTFIRVTVHAADLALGRFIRVTDASRAQ